jgi:hypothetical protein
MLPWYRIWQSIALLVQYGCLLYYYLSVNSSLSLGKSFRRSGTSVASTTYIFVGMSDELSSHNISLVFLVFILVVVALNLVIILGSMLYELLLLLLDPPPSPGRRKKPGRRAACVVGLRGVWSGGPIDRFSSSSCRRKDENVEDK